MLATIGHTHTTHRCHFMSGEKLSRLPLGSLFGQSEFWRSLLVKSSLSLTRFLINYQPLK